MLELSQIKMGDNKTPNMSQLEGEIQINVAEFSFLKGNQFKRRKGECPRNSNLHTVSFNLLRSLIHDQRNGFFPSRTPSPLYSWLKTQGLSLVSSGDPAKRPQPHFARSLFMNLRDDQSFVTDALQRMFVAPRAEKAHSKAFKTHQHLWAQITLHCELGPVEVYAWEFTTFPFAPLVA